MISSALQTLLAMNILVAPSIRTSNDIEFNPALAKIGSTFGAFMQQYSPTFKPTSKIVATYSNYASDHNGAYDYALGLVETSEHNELKSFTIPAGKYMVFSAQGEFPAVVVQTWMHIWQYFETHPEQKRAYTLDFECYDCSKPAGSIDIYIALQ